MKSHFEFFSKNQEKNYMAEGKVCDLCGRKHISVKAHKSEDIICLCSKCSDYIENLPIYSKNCIERFLIGNIL